MLLVLQRWFVGETCCSVLVACGTVQQTLLLYPPSCVVTCEYSVVLLPGSCLAKGALEAKYKKELDEAFGIVFNNLFTITNMPIKVQSRKTYLAFILPATEKLPPVS